MSEAKILADIRQAVGSLQDARVFRNNVGVLPDKNGRMVPFGLCVGSHDLIAIKSVVITPEMVGQTIGVFATIEVKDIDGRATKEQKNFRKMVRALGGRSGIARSVDDALKIIAGLATGETDEPRDR